MLRDWIGGGPPFERLFDIEQDSDGVVEARLKGVAASHGSDAGGRAGEDQVAGLHGEDRGTMGDECGDAEDHVLRAAVLLDDIVDLRTVQDEPAGILRMQRRTVSQRRVSDGSGS